MIACPSLPLGPQILILRIIRRIDEHCGALALPQDLDLELAADRREVGLDVTQSQALA